MTLEVVTNLYDTYKQKRTERKRKRTISHQLTSFLRYFKVDYSGKQIVFDESELSREKQTSVATFTSSIAENPNRTVSIIVDATFPTSKTTIEEPLISISINRSIINANENAVDKSDKERSLQISLSFTNFDTPKQSTTLRLISSSGIKRTFAVNESGVINGFSPEEFADFPEIADFFKDLPAIDVQKTAEALLDKKTYLASNLPFIKGFIPTEIGKKKSKIVKFHYSNTNSKLPLEVLEEKNQLVQRDGKKTEIRKHFLVINSRGHFDIYVSDEEYNDPILLQSASNMVLQEALEQFEAIKSDIHI